MGWLREVEKLTKIRAQIGDGSLVMEQESRKLECERLSHNVLLPLQKRWEELGISSILADVKALLEKKPLVDYYFVLGLREPNFVLPLIHGERVIVAAVSGDEWSARQGMPFGDPPDLAWEAACLERDSAVGLSIGEALAGLEGFKPYQVSNPYFGRAIIANRPIKKRKSTYKREVVLGMKLMAQGLELDFDWEEKIFWLSARYLTTEAVQGVIVSELMNLIAKI